MVDFDGEDALLDCIFLMAEEKDMRVLPVAADIPVGSDEVRVADEGGPDSTFD